MLNFPSVINGQTGLELAGLAQLAGLEESKITTGLIKNIMGAVVAEQGRTKGIER